MVDEELIDRVYQAAVVPGAWPEVLQAIADHAGARGAMFMVRSPRTVDWVASPRLAEHVADYVAAGWITNVDHAAPLCHEQWPGFRAEIDYRTPEEIAELPVHREFLDPRGFVAGVGTVFQGAADDALHLTLEGFANHDAARVALPWLDGLRPHLGRALSLTTHMRAERDRAAMDALELSGVAAAMVDTHGRLRAANARFAARLGNAIFERRGTLTLADPFANTALYRVLAGNAGVQSVAVARADPLGPFALHIVPLAGIARERAGSDGALLLVAEPGNASVPEADLLRLLFDLTAAEARLARHILHGESLAAAARKLGVTEATARTQLRVVFVKTGTDRQAGLVRLLTGLALPR